MISFQQKMNRTIRARSVLSHYFGRNTVWISPAGGVALVAVFILMDRLQIKLPFHNIYILFFAALFILRPLINMMHIYFDIRMGKGREESLITIEFDENAIVTKDEDSENRFELSKLFKFRISKNFIFLYSSKTQYFFIDKRQVEQSQIDYMEGVLSS